MTQKQLVIFGFGNQARAWALNLRDSGWDVYIYLRNKSSSLQKVQKLKFPIIDSYQLNMHKNFALLTPDHTHAEILKKFKSKLSQDAKIVYAHGFSLQSMNVQNIIECSHLLLAPKAIASELRFQFETKGKIGGAFSLEFSKNINDRKWLLDLAKDLGITAGPFEVSIQEETYADLFSEQSLLCSLLPYAALECYNSLREKNVSKEISYLETWYEMKLIVDTMVKMGPEKFFSMISPNALYGSEKGRKLLIDDKFKQNLKTIIDDIFSKNFENEVENKDIEVIKKRVQKFWSSTEFIKTHQSLEGDLFS